MAIDFPNLPSLNQEFTVGTRTWIWDGTVWKSKTRNLQELVDDGVADANEYTDNAIAAHSILTANVHGIANTLALATLSDLSNKQDVVANVGSTEIGYLDGVTAPIQTQLNGKANSSHNHDINDITNLANTLTNKANAVHTHTISDVENLSTTLSGKANTAHTHSISDVTDLSSSLSNKANASHTHAISDIIDLANSLSDKANVTHTHTISDIANITASVEEINVLDGITATTTELNYLDGVTSNVQLQIDSKANSSHTHLISDISNITASADEINLLDGATVTTTELNYLDGVTSNVQSQIDGKANSSHTHTISDIANVTVTVDEINVLDGITATTTELNYVDGVTSNIQAQLNDKANATHGHLISDIANVTASTNEINILDGANVTTAELNYLVGTTSNVQAQINSRLSLSGGTMTGKITLDGDPTQANHAANKGYVDSLSEGLHIHPSVVAATTTNINLATDLENGDIIDGVTLATGNRVLVKNQNTASQNGIYVVQASGAPSRAADFDTPQEVDGGDFVFVNQGTVNGDTGWVQVSDTIATIGVDPITFTQFSGAGTIQAGNNISVNGYQVSVVSNPSFANLTITSSIDLSNATITGIGLNDIANVITNTNTAGDVLYYNGTNWVNRYVNAIPAKMATPTITSNNYTITSGDEGMILEFGSNNATTVTIPTSETFANGTQMIIIQAGTGQVSVIAQNTAVQTFNYSPGNILRSQWSAATLLKRSANNWVMYGDLIAP